MEWYLSKNIQEIKDSLLICENCYLIGNTPKDLKKEDFKKSNIYDIFDPVESIINHKYIIFFL